MPTRRPADNVVNDESLKSAFAQGVEEGMALRGAKVIYLIEFWFEGTKLNERRTDDIMQALDWADDHLDQGVGTRIVISVETGITPSSALDTGSDDDVVDAEIIEGGQA